MANQLVTTNLILHSIITVPNSLLLEHKRQDQQALESFEWRIGEIHEVKMETSPSVVPKLEKPPSKKYSELDDALLNQNDTDTTSYLDDYDEGDISFNPPVKYVYIPRTPHMKLGDQSKQSLQQKTVRSKSANDKKIKDILNKGRERFLRKNSYRSVSNVN